MVAEGILVKAPRGGYDLDDCRRRTLEYLRNRAKRRPTDHGSIEDARLANLTADTALKDARREELEGRSIPRTAVDRVLDEAGATLRKRMESLGADLSEQTTGDPASDRALIDREVRARMEAFAAEPLDEALDRARAEESPADAEPEPEPKARKPRAKKARKR